jgi:hypothetical protein
VIPATARRPNPRGTISTNRPANTAIARRVRRWPRAALTAVPLTMNGSADSPRSRSAPVPAAA